MNKFYSSLSLLLLIAIIYWGFYTLLPQNISTTTADTSFSTRRALTHVKAISEKPHYVGSKAHEEVRQYIVAELRKMGLETEIQEGYTAGDWGNLSKAHNILAKIEGTENNRSLLLLSHYDSNPHSSLGASDDGSGVATILEGVRAFLARETKPKNDIIILISDAEELGLNGAQLFVNEHLWAKEVGLVLNFEARGSGGPAFMLMETNNGNKNLIENFKLAHPEYPVANSLFYSVYKMLPNDTDLTVFREDGNIEGFNFAFIDDHFDYHTVLDNYDRLDRNTLEHQGSYLMPLLEYFSDQNLNNLKSDEDYIYFNFPVFDLVMYPFSWNVPLLILTAIAFIFLLIYGFKKEKLQLKEIGKGALAFLISLIICGAIGYFSWPVLNYIYPEYQDMQHGFTYNGYSYIMAFVLISTGICFLSYNLFRSISTVNLVIFPVFIWVIICGAVTFYLSGAAFFIIFVIAALLSLYVLINQKKPGILVLTLLALPALWILPFFIKSFPVGLGMKMMVTSTILTVLTFGLLTSIFGFYSNKKSLGLILLLSGFVFIVRAHFRSDFTTDRPHPTSLVYMLDADSQNAIWATYNHDPDIWIEQFIGDDKKQLSPELVFSSKYNSGFSYTATAPLIELAIPEVEIRKDTITEGFRSISLCIVPHRNVNRLDIFTEKNNIRACRVNGLELSEDYLKNRNHKLITHYISNNDSTELEISIPADEELQLSIYESAFDLLEDSRFRVPKRPENAIPMPFILNDAVIIRKNIKL